VNLCFESSGKLSDAFVVFLSILASATLRYSRVRSYEQTKHSGTLDNAGRVQFVCLMEMASSSIAHVPSMPLLRRLCLAFTQTGRYNEELLLMNDVLEQL